jgi:hypothetical protein
LSIIPNMPEFEPNGDVLGENDMMKRTLHAPTARRSP